MSQTDPRIDTFFAQAPVWQAELLLLRQIVLGCGLTEEWKWSSPVYTAQGGNVAILWGFKDRATLGFFKGVLLADPEGILAPPGDNSRSARVVNFTSLAQIVALSPVLQDYLAQAIEVEKAGMKVDFAKDDLHMPEELAQTLATDAPLRAAFDALTPGRQRSWILHIGQAKAAATRLGRVEKARPAILAGKGLNDR
ncbi:YdeI/OmpD-associated family protein [Fuscibacter oryzae]|uniref:YdeI/OmpD-associated family protein n=1 Tax=Fuscibacter oryzae TaxID=2803939 RepID=A0A8J7MNU7_9RHOB|nr:YdeI/OmpD-associated family protein [Fuscibacter oryzae]MBL4926737.1 YdeI/OmpD-associated family protein [Fuscibacter oryzae]